MVFDTFLQLFFVVFPAVMLYSFNQENKWHIFNLAAEPKCFVKKSTVIGVLYSDAACPVLIARYSVMSVCYSYLLS